MHNELLQAYYISFFLVAGYLMDRLREISALVLHMRESNRPNWSRSYQTRIIFYLPRLIASINFVCLYCKRSIPLYQNKLSPLKTCWFFCSLLRTWKWFIEYVIWYQFWKARKLFNLHWLFTDTISYEIRKICRHGMQ